MALISGNAVLLCIPVAFVLLIIRFLTPKIDSREPPLVYPRIPIIGHLIGMMKHNIDYFPKILRNTPHAVVTLPVLNGKVYVITSPDLVASALRQRTLDFTPFVEDFSQSLLNVSHAGMQTIKAKPSIPKGPSYMQDVHNAMHESMQPGPGLSDMNQKVLEVLVGFTNDIGPAWESKQLYDWFREIFTISSSRALYGPNDIIGQEPALIDHLWNFEEDTSLLMMLPFMAKKANTGRSAVQSAFLRYYQEGNDRDATALVQSRNTAARKWGHSVEDIANFELSILFVTTTNAMPSAFWLLCYILTHPTLRKELEAELSTIYTIETNPHDGTKEAKIDISKFNGQTPVLVSAYHETLRLQNAQVSARKVMQDTTLHSQSTGRDYLLKAGNTLQIPSGLTHTSSTVWGTNTETFDAHRFLRRDNPSMTTKESKKAQTQGFFPFGGGKHLCPGRFFAQAEILGLVSVLLLGYEVSGVDAVPKARMQKFGVGVRKPDGDVSCRIRRRAEMADLKWSFIVGEGIERPLDFA